MLKSDFSRKAHANFQNYFSFVQCVFQHTDVKSTSISCTIEVHIESNFHFCIFIDVFNHFNATNIKEDYFRCVNNPTTYKIFDGSEKTVPHFVTSV